ncbi:MAG: HRDC domain-containing protein, partial [Pseudomonadota bacterium]
QTVYLRLQAKLNRLSEKRQDDDLAIMDSTERYLWEQLRTWRAKTAKEYGVPAYVIFHDTTLRELVRLCPQTEDELRLVTGIGMRKLDKYGNHLIEILRNS